MNSNFALGITSLVCAVALHAAADQKPSPLGYRTATQPADTQSSKTRRQEPRRGRPRSLPERSKDADSRTAAIQGDAVPEDVGTACFFIRRRQSMEATGGSADGGQLTAAHPSFPLGSRVRVTNIASGRSVTVTVTDRGSFVGGRIISVSKPAAQRLGFVNAGTARVRVELISDQVAAL